MRRNAAGQKIQAMMRTTSATIQAIVSLSNATVTGATNANPIVVTTEAHGLIPGNRVEISGVGGNTAANGTFVVTAVTTTTITLGDTTNGANVAGNGGYTSGGTVVALPVNVFVSKDGGALTTGAGTLSHIGKGPLNIAHTADKRQFRARATSASAGVTAVGVTDVTLASGGINSSTYGLWSYTPTASETNAANVAFIFTAAALGAISVTQTFEPTSGPILYQALLSATGGAVTNQTTIVLPSATPIPAADDDAYNNAVMVFYDGTTEGQASVCTILDYVGSTRTITLREAPTFTVTTSDYVTIISDQSLHSATKNRNLVVDASGLADANTVKIGPTGSGTAQTARDIGTSVLLSSGTGTGQVSLTSGGVLCSTLATQAKADVNAEALDVLNTDTFAEPAQGAPGATVSLVTKIGYLYKAWRNKKTQTATDYKLFNDDAATVDHKAAVSDDATTTTIGEVATGP